MNTLSEGAESAHTRAAGSWGRNQHIRILEYTCKLFAALILKIKVHFYLNITCNCYGLFDEYVDYCLVKLEIRRVLNTLRTYGRVVVVSSYMAQRRGLNPRAGH